MKCPLCSKEMIKRHGPFGDFYGCTDFPKCRGNWSQENEDRKQKWADQAHQRLLQWMGRQYKKEHMERMGYTRKSYRPSWKSGMGQDEEHAYDDWCGFSSGDFGDN